MKNNYFMIVLKMSFGFHRKSHGWDWTVVCYIVAGSEQLIFSSDSSIMFRPDKPINTFSSIKTNQKLNMRKLR
jgi:hypothetical protein